jgi:aspartyl-tRNA(Asn)/glutamyl-tRNA(Gln) amidotransferase subunit C
MDINDEMIARLADLAKLEFNGEETEKIKGDLNRILTYFETLNQVNTEGVEPLIFMSEGVNILREDISGQTVSKAEALKNAPSKDSDYFKVPKFIEK